MITISTRVDDQLKENAERVADSIGLSLSAAINVFLRRFVIEEGFPFDVKVPNVKTRKEISSMSAEDITEIIRRGIMEASADPRLPASVYIDPVTNQLTTHNSN